MKKFFGLFLFYTLVMLMGWYTGTFLIAFFTWSPPVFYIPGWALRVGFVWVLCMSALMIWRGRNENN